MSEFPQSLIAHYWMGTGTAFRWRLCNLQLSVTLIYLLGVMVSLDGLIMICIFAIFFFFSFRICAIHFKHHLNIVIYNFFYIFIFQTIHKLQAVNISRP